MLSLVLAVVALSAYLLLRGGDATPDGAGPTDGAAPFSTRSTDAEPDPLDDPLSLDSIDLRYEALAGSVTTGSAGCRAVKAREGQRERVLCDAPVGTLELVTYRTAADLAARRDRAVTQEPGSVLDARTDGTLMAFEAPAPVKSKKANPQGRPGKAASGVETFLYWDDQRAVQSATYATDAGTTLDGLVAAYGATGPTRPYPTGLRGQRLVSFAQRWAETDECLRIPTVNPGALEESYCDVEGPVEMFVGRFDSLADLNAYAKIVVASAVADDRDLREWPRGTLYEYKTDDSTVSRYWDDATCLCYAEAFLADGTYAGLARWWDQK